MNVAIVDDLESDRQNLKSHLQLWSDQRRVSIEYHSFVSGEDFAACFEQEKFDLVFMDIYLPQMTGIDAAGLIRRKSQNIPVVFLTTSREHAWESFRLHPFDYLIKPCGEREVFYVMDEFSRLYASHLSVLELKVGRQTLPFSYDDICLIQANSHHVILSTGSGEDFRCYVPSFSVLWETLHLDPRFLLCNRGIILNMDYVAKTDDTCFFMENGSTLPIRQRNRNEVIQTFVNYQYQKTKSYHERLTRHDTQ